MHRPIERLRRHGDNQAGDGPRQTDPLSLTVPDRRWHRENRQEDAAPVRP
jgi:hypothetical protein